METIKKLLTALSQINPPKWLESYLKEWGAEKDDPDNWAQTSHVAVAYGIVLTVALLAEGPWSIAILVTLVSFFIEFWFDLRYEKNETLATSWEDWYHWLIGAYAAVGFWYLAEVLNR